MEKKDLKRCIPILRDYYRGFRRPSVTRISEEFNKPFFVLISCVLSLRTKDKTTNEASDRLFALADTPEQLVGVSVKKIEKTIYPVGFYRTKANSIKSISHDIITRFKGSVPDNMDDLLSLKGVGRKTANLVLTLGFNKLGICVDTHVHRISNRLGFVKTKNPFQTEMALRNKLPKKFWREYNDLLVAFGQNICKPVSPFCSTCRIYKYCLRDGVKRNR
ncbi:endonuclease III domain-containing protein [Thermoproteota archaeon]